MPRTRHKIFISYSRKDKECAERFHSRLIYNIPKERVFWDRAPEGGMQSGDQWERRIDDEIGETRVALFLLSENFRSPGFGRTYELPAIIRAQQTDPRLKIYWVQLREIDPPVELEKIHGRCTDTGLESLPEDQRNAQINSISKEMIAELDIDAGTHDDFFDRVKIFTRRDLGYTIEREISKGSTSIIYSAVGGGRRCVVKAQLADMLNSEGAIDQGVLDNHLEHAKELDDPVFIKLFGGLIRKDLRLLVSEYLSSARSLASHLEMNRSNDRSTPVWLVRVAMSSLAKALDQYHSKGLIFGNVRPSDVLVQHPSKETWRFRLPALRLARIETMRDKVRGSYNFDLEVMNSLTPEQHEASCVTQKTDQYSLALLGIEMLMNEPPVQVFSLSDLKTKEDFFDNPESFGNWAKRSPRLRPILLKMLSRNPEDRFASMADIVDELRTQDSIVDDNRMIAKENYSELNERGVWYDLLSELYEYLTQFRKDWEVPFQQLSKNDKHIEKLDQAILFLLNFRETDGDIEPTILTRLREQHGSLKLTGSDFADFGVGLLAMLNKFDDISEETQSAWISTIAPGLTYMSYDLEGQAKMEERLRKRKKPRRRNL